MYLSLRTQSLLVTLRWQLERPGEEGTQATATWGMNPTWGRPAASPCPEPKAVLGTSQRVVQSLPRELLELVLEFLQPPFPSGAGAVVMGN